MDLGGNGSSGSTTGVSSPWSLIAELISRHSVTPDILPTVVSQRMTRFSSLYAPLALRLSSPTSSTTGSRVYSLDGLGCMVVPVFTPEILAPSSKVLATRPSSHCTRSESVCNRSCVYSKHSRTLQSESILLFRQGPHAGIPPSHRTLRC